MATLLDMIEDDIELAQGDEFATEVIPCPEGVFDANIHSITRRAFVSGETTYHLLNVRWLIDSEDAREETKMDKVYVDQPMFLNLDIENCRNMESEEAAEQLWVVEKEGNPTFGRFLKWASMIGYERPTSWIKFWVNLEDDLKGKEAMVSVKQSLRKTKELDDDGQPRKVIQSSISGIAKHS